MKYRTANELMRVVLNVEGVEESCGGIIEGCEDDRDSLGIVERYPPSTPLNTHQHPSTALYSPLQPSISLYSPQRPSTLFNTSLRLSTTTTHSPQQ